MRLRLIACEVFHRELCHLVACSPHQVDLGFLPKGLHDLGRQGMSARLQQAIDELEDPVRYEALLLGYGLCNNGTIGLVARKLPLVIPRSHDCIGLFLGSARRYRDCFEADPGTYYLTSGWIERGEPTDDLKALSVQRRSGLDLTYAELVECYGEDNARYLAETLHQGKHYGQYTFIGMGIPGEERFAALAREQAVQRGWRFRKEAGDLGWLRALVDGEWDEERFLRLQPGQRSVAVHDGRLLAAASVEG